VSVDARIRELLLANLVEVFNVRDPKRRLEAIERNYTEDVTWTDPDGTNMGVPEQPSSVKGIDVALVRDGRIAVLNTFLTAEG